MLKWDAAIDKEELLDVIESLDEIAGNSKVGSY